MGKNYVENSLKRFLKRKVKITLGLVVAFMITGMVSFGADKPVEEMNDFEKAEYYLAGLGKSNIKQGEYKDSTGKYTITVAENGEISFSGFDTTGDGKEDVIPSISNNMISKVTKELLESGALSGELSVTNKGSKLNTGVLLNGQSEFNNAENKGIILSNNRGQYVWAGNLYNYGLIINNGLAGGQTIWGANKGENPKVMENYGVIISKGQGQEINTNAKNEISYNFGYIQSSKNGQFLNEGDNISAYNYGIINSTNENGQIIANKVQNSEIRNYGLIEANKFAQSVTGETNSAYNFGIIRGNHTSLVEVKENAKTYNDGIIINESGTGIYSNDVKENAVNNGMIVINGESITDNFTNNGVVLNSSFDVIDKQGINKDVVELTNGQAITNSTVGNIATGKTSGYIKNASALITENLTDKNLNAVVTETKDKAVFTYENKDNENFALVNTTVTGYFQNAGTLLDVKSGEIFTIAGDTKITAIKDKGITGDVTAVKLSNGAILNIVGEAEIVGKVTGAEAGIGMTANNGGKDDNGNKISKTEADRDVKTIIISNASQELIDNKVIAQEDNYTNINFTNTKVDDLEINFGITAKDEVNKIVLGEEVHIKNGIDGSKTTESNDLQLEITNISNIGGDIKLGASDDSITINKYETYDKVIDMGAGNDSFTVNGFAQSTTKADNHKELGTFDYKLSGVETITLKGDGITGNNGWHIGKDAEIVSKGENGTTLIIDSEQLHVEMNNNFGAGNVTTSLDKLAGENGANGLVLETSKDEKTGENTGLVKFVVGDKFNVSDKQFDITPNYNIKEGANLGTAVIFKGTGENGAVEQKDGKVTLTVKEASELGLSDYKGIYDAVLGGLSEYDDLRDKVNYANEGDFVGLIKGAGNTAEAFYTTGYAVTKDVTDTYMSVIEDFGRKAGKGEWIAYGKYVNSDTEFDGGKASKGYDGDITGTVGMIEYGVNDTTSYGVVYGQGDTKVDIQGGGKLDGDNTYFGGYVKHRTQNGIDLTGNIGITKSELDLSLVTDTKYQSIITDGNSDADALTFSIKGTKDYKVTDTIRLQPVVSGRYSFISQDEVTSSDANFKMDAQDVTIFEGTFGGKIIKDFDIYNGRLSLSAGAEYVLTDVNKDDNARYHLYNEDLYFAGEEDIADSRIEGHIGIDYEHESGIGVDAKYEMIWTDKGDNSRVTAGVSYRF